MSNVMQQGCQLNNLSIQLYVIDIVAPIVFEKVSPSAYDRIKHPFCNMHDTERMFKAGVRCTWINHIRQSQLTNSAQSLENPMIYDIPFPLIQLNESVDRIANLVLLCHVDYYLTRVALVASN